MPAPICPSYTGTLYSLCVPPLVAYVWSLCCVTAFGIAFFCLIILFFVLPPVCFICIVVFHMFTTWVFFFCEEPAFDGFLYFVGSTRSFHSSFQSFISHCTSSVVTQYTICRHSFSGSLFSWIHILFLDVLKLVLFLYSSTTSSGIIQVSATFSCIYSRSVMNMLEFVFISLAIVVCHNVFYCVVRHFLVL
jgi:hypothetical protein